MSPVPWNKDRCVGQRLALTPGQTRCVGKLLYKKRRYRDRCLFMLAVDSMLRCSDLLRLRVRDVMQDHVTVRSHLSWKQQKTRKGVFPVLTESTQKACGQWVAESGKRLDDYLFTREGESHGKPISSSAYRALVKDWVTLIGLDNTDYSTHSLRRTKPVYLYRNGVLIEDIAILLGHKDPQSTMHYLGLTVEAAQSKAIAFDIFRPKKQRTYSPMLSDRDIERIARRVVELIQKTSDPTDNEEH